MVVQVGGFLGSASLPYPFLTDQVLSRQSRELEPLLPSLLSLRRYPMKSTYSDGISLFPHAFEVPISSLSYLFDPEQSFCF